MKKNLLLVCVLTTIVFHSVNLSAQDKPLPPIHYPGLTLSGGGAKGLAHIGTLYILDSLGIKVKCISGTSMGSIVGGMYAAGYSAKEIEDFATNINWDDLLSPRSSMKFIPPQERLTAGKSIIELSVADGKIKLPTGVIEGQQLWNTLNEIFLPTYQISDFNKLPIPFACVATDVESGTPVIMRNGNLTSAIRASMAIPSIFTTVERDGKKLIDGGVVQNFPVTVVKEMGADFVIGVNVSKGLLPAKDLKNPFDIIYQMGFYVAAQNFSSDFKQVDIYIEPDLTGYSVSSFADAAAIIERGKIAARKQLPALIELAERLKDSGLQQDAIAENIPEKLYVLDTITIKGNHHSNNHYIAGKLRFHKGDTLSAKEFTSAVNRLYASDYFERINYQLSPALNPANVSFNLELTEKTSTRLSAGVNFSSFTGVGLIGGWTTNRFVFRNTHGYAKVLLGQNPIFRAGLSYYLSENQKNWLNLEIYGFRLKFPLYENFKAVSEYQQSWIQPKFSVNKLTGKNSYLTLGTSFFYQELKPTILTAQTVKGNNLGFETYLIHRYITIDQNAFPHSGQNIRFQLSYIHGQDPSLNVSTTGVDAGSSSDLNLQIKDFFQAYFGWDIYIPFGRRVTQLIKFKGGYNFDDSENFLNNFNIGGTNNFLDKQLVFSGLNDYEILSNSALSGAFGFQYQLSNSLFASWLINGAVYDFDLKRLEKVNIDDNFVLGAGLSLGYLSLLGPVEITVSYSPQTDKIISYITLGWSF